MQVIFNRQLAEELSDRYIILEMETFELPDNQKLETFCVVSAEQMDLRELPNVDVDKKFHQKFIQELKQKNYQFCLEAVEQLKGKFGGELDSFYETIRERSKLALEQKQI